jgi:hypothetical protein
MAARRPERDAGLTGQALKDVRQTRVLEMNEGVTKAGLELVIQNGQIQELEERIEKYKAEVFRARDELYYCRGLYADMRQEVARQLAGLEACFREQDITLPHAAAQRFFSLEALVEVTCPVCFQEAGVEALTLLMPCRHSFCLTCTERIFVCLEDDEPSKCPVCRGSVWKDLVRYDMFNRNAP